MTNLIRPEGPEPDDFRFSRRALATGALGGLAFAGYAPAALARQAAPITTDGEGLTQEEATVEAPDGFALPIFVARPAGDGPWPVVVVAVLDAGVAWYGRLAPAPTATPEQVASGQPWPVDLADDLKCPVLGLYGEADRGIPLTSVEAMRAALQRAGQTESGIHVYPGAPHAFHADYRDSYRAADAADGWAKLLAFFGERLK